MNKDYFGANNVRPKGWISDHKEYKDCRQEQLLQREFQTWVQENGKDKWSAIDRLKRLGIHDYIINLFKEEREFYLNALDEFFKLKDQEVNEKMASLEKRIAALEETQNKIQQEKMKKLEELKLQFLAQNPSCCLSVPAEEGYNERCTMV